MNKLLGALILVLTAQAHAVGVQTFNLPCSTWTQQRTTRTADPRGFAFGYLSGLAVAGERDILKGVTPETIMTYVDVQCARTPYTTVIEVLNDWVSTVLSK